MKAQPEFVKAKSNSFFYFFDIGKRKTWNLLKVTNRNTRKRCEVCSKLTIKRSKRRLASF